MEARGAITLKNVTASQYANLSEATAGHGAYLKNDHTAGLIYPVTITNGIFSGNHGFGLECFHWVQ